MRVPTESIYPRSDPALAEVRVVRVDDSGPSERPDVLAVEEPLEIRVGSHDSDDRASGTAGASPSPCGPRATTPS